MPDKTEYRPRMSIDVREDQKRDLDTLVPWGMMRRLMEVVLDSLIELLKVNKEVIIGGLITGKLKFTVELKDGNDGN